MFCSKCGKEIHDEAVICVHCGCAVNNNNLASFKANNDKGHDWLPTLLFAWFLGAFGAHRFYTGHIGIGIAQLLTLGGCGIWAFIDWILICFNKFDDADGKPLNGYKKDIGPILFVIGLLITVAYVFILILGAAVSE